MLSYENMILFVVVHLFDIIFREIAVSAFVYLVLPAVAIARFHSMVSPVLVPCVHSIANDFTTIQAYAFFSQFSPHKWRVYTSQLLLVVTVVQWFTVVVSSWYLPFAVRTVDNFLVMAVLAHLSIHIGFLKLGMADNAVVEFHSARYNIMRLFTLAYHLQVNVLTHIDFPFEWNTFKPFFRFLLGHRVEPAKGVAKLNGFLPELEY